MERIETDGPALVRVQARDLHQAAARGDVLARVARNAHGNLNGGSQAAIVEFANRRQLQPGARREFLLFVFYLGWHAFLAFGEVKIEHQAIDASAFQLAQGFAIQVIAVADQDKVSLRQTRTGAAEAFKDRRVGHRFVVSRPNQGLFVSDAGKIVENAFVKRVLHDYVLRAAVDKRVRTERTGTIAVAVILDFHDSDERGEEFLHVGELQRRLEKCGGKQVSDQRLAKDPDGWMHACLPKETENRGLQNCAPDDTALKYGSRMRTRPAVYGSFGHSFPLWAQCVLPVALRTRAFSGRGYTSSLAISLNTTYFRMAAAHCTKNQGACRA